MVILAALVMAVTLAVQLARREAEDVHVAEATHDPAPAAVPMPAAIAPEQASADARAPASQEPRPIVDRAAPRASYAGNVSGAQMVGGHLASFRMGLTMTLTRNGNIISGTWKGSGRVGGRITGTLISGARYAIHLSQSPPCRGEYDGAAELGQNGSLYGTYGGSYCYGTTRASFQMQQQ